MAKDKLFLRKLTKLVFILISSAILAFLIVLISTLVTANAYDSVISITELSLTISGILISLEIFTYSDMLKNLNTTKKPRMDILRLLHNSSKVIKSFIFVIIASFITNMICRIPDFPSKFNFVVLSFMILLVLLEHAMERLLDLVNYPKKLYPKEFEKIEDEERKNKLL
jgi:hypothetical protein